ncbi:TPA: hypothetical protein J4332_005234, partial [Escherichia coli]|nr:hypothetical protein [Escherichia coli]
MVNYCLISLALTTELERHLLNALEQLQQDYMQRLNEWESAFVELQ